MDLGVISLRYARALLKCATKQKQETEVYAEMKSLMDSYIHFPLLRQTLDNPLLDNKDKVNLPQPLLFLKTQRTNCVS